MAHHSADPARLPWTIRHLNGLIWIYLLSVVPFFLLEWISTGYVQSFLVAFQLPPKTPWWTYPVAGTIFAVLLVIWVGLLIRIPGRLVSALRPLEESQSSDSFARADRRRLLAVLRTLSRFDGFVEIYRHTYAFFIMGISLGSIATVAVLFFPVVVTFLVFTVFAFGFSIPVIAIVPSVAIGRLQSVHRLLIAITVLQSLPLEDGKAEEPRGFSKYLYERHQRETTERFLLQKIVTYTDSILRETAPGLMSDTSPYWAAIYAARALRRDSESSAAQKLLRRQRTILAEKGHMVDTVRSFLTCLFEAKTELPSSWHLVEDGRFMIERERASSMRTKFGSLFLLVVPQAIVFIISLLRPILKI